MSDSELIPSEDQVDLIDQTDGFFKPKMLEVTILMSRTLVVIAMSAVLGAGIPAVQAESQQPVAPEVAEAGYLQSAKDFGSRVLSSTRDNISKVFDQDERVELLKQKEQAYLHEIVSLKKQLIERDLELGVKHQYLSGCAQEVADYLNKLQVQQEVK